MHLHPTYNVIHGERLRAAVLHKLIFLVSLIILVRKSFAIIITIIVLFVSVSREIGSMQTKQFAEQIGSKSNNNDNKRNRKHTMHL